MVIKHQYDSESFFVSLIKWFFVLKNSMGSICKGIETITSLLRIPSACSSLIARLQRKKSVKTFQSQLEVQRIGVGTGSPSPPFWGAKLDIIQALTTGDFLLVQSPSPTLPAFGTSVYIQCFIYIFYKNTELVPLRESTIWGKIATSIYSTYGPKGVSERDRFKSTE